METSKLYSEVLKEIENKSNVLCEDEGKEHSVVDDFNFQELALSIEQLVIDKMEDVLAWIESNAYHKDGSWYLHENMSGEIYTKKQLIQLYLNK